ncbi:hypothetical protein EDB86DRAFT_2933253 [Lactarius hatsudake]|nr:hypothetical protein EDB86DRAFT_2933253 [Lactarius hatsudake]
MLGLAHYIKFFSFLFFLLTILLTIVFQVLPCMRATPLLQGKHRHRHAIHHTTTPCPLAPTFPPPLRHWASAHYIKISFFRARTTATPPPHGAQPPPLRRQHTNDDGDAVVLWWEQHGGRINGGGDVAAAAGMAMVCGRDDGGGGNDGGGTPVLPLCISVLYFTSMQ